MLTPSLVDLAYAAGFFDGEGCVSISRRGRAGIFVLDAATYQKIAEPLLWLQARWGGRMARRKAGGYVLTLSGPTAARFLQAVLPYLQVKQKAAQIGLEFQATKRQTNTGLPLTADEFAQRMSLCESLRRVNGWNWRTFPYKQATLRGANR